MATTFFGRILLFFLISKTDRSIVPYIVSGMRAKGCG